LVTTKTYDTHKVAEELNGVINKNTEVVTLQNGLRGLEILQQNVVNPARVFGGVTLIGASREDERSIKVGQYDKTSVDAGATKLVQILKATPYELDVRENVQQAIWEKLVLTGVQNALSTATNQSQREMLNSAPCLDIAENLLNELELVARAEHISFKWPLIDHVKQIWSSGEDFYPSMRQDLHNGRRTEIDAINSAIARLGKKHDIPTPYHSMIASLVKALEIKAIG
jgi:2-dehydropantoate 2-reductase